MKTRTRTSIDGLFAEIQRLEAEIQAADSDPDSAEYWRKAAASMARQRDLWQEIRDRTVIAENVPGWARRAAFLALENCSDKVYRYEAFVRQCEEQAAKA